MNRYKLDIAVGVAAFIVVALIAYVIYIRYMPDEPTGSNFTPSEQSAIDSLAHAWPGFVHRQDSIKTLIVHDTIESTRLQEAAGRSQAKADRLQSRADSLALAAGISQDSVRSWKLAYEARTEEATTLRVTILEKDSIITDERAARDRFRELWVTDTLRRVKLEKLNTDLQETVKGLVKPCKIGPLPCPSRKVIAASAYALGKISVFRKK